MELKATNRNFEVIGTLSEMNIEEELGRDITLNDGKKVKGSAIHGSMVIDVNGSPITIKTMWTNSINKDGKPNTKNYKAMQTIMNTYIPKTKATDETPADRIKVNGMLGLNEYAGDKGWMSNLDITSMQCTRKVSADIEDKAVVKLAGGVIKDIKPEMIKKGDEMEESGRLEVTYYMFDKNNALLPVKIFIAEDMVEDYNDLSDDKDDEERKPIKGDTVDIDMDIVQHVIGGKKADGKKGFGKKVDITTGFTIQELVLSWISFPYSDDLKIDLKLVKVAEKERENFIVTETKKSEDRKKAGGTTSSTSTGKGKGLGTPKVVVPVSDDEEDGDSPF